MHTKFTSPYSEMNIDELLAEKKRILDGLSEAHKVLREFQTALNLINNDITRTKMPTAGTSIANRLKAMPVLTTKRVEEPVIEPKPTPPVKKKEYYQPSISEHALVRYMERVMDIDVDNLRNSILTKDIKAALSMGSTRIKINDIEMIAAGGKIITIVD